MSYEFIQAALTNLITFTAIAGFTGIVAHSFIQQHRRFMAEFCPPVAPYTPDTQVAQPQVTEVPVIVEPQPIEEDVWDGEVEQTLVVYFRPVSRHFSPQLALPPAQEGVKPSTKKTRKSAAKPKTPAKTRTTRKRKVA